MPFGKHEGVPLHDLPWTYLQWLSEQEWIHTKRPTLAAAIRAELALRDGLAVPVVPARVVELIEGGFRATAMKHHPDHGGSNEAMREVIERYRKMERAGARLIFGPDAAQWRPDGSLTVKLA